ncbi:MAG: amino acid ABC transporter permease [Erysipelotrichaceae bacterium]|nr:amino acid ABC transporter permease [Erysipelotrichaceae bacterium]MBR2791302.1 amino acid ABC transporter permease [Erysipelotrichaceae bacterium]
MDFSIITPEIFAYLIRGAGMSLLIAAIATAMGLILGTLGAAAKLSRSKFLNALASVYVEVFRGTPMIMQITFAFLALPALVTLILGRPIRFNPLITGIAAISINSGAYTTELIRSGINGVDKGQFEAADTLGLTYRQKMRLVILPQAFKQILPPLVSEFITLIKDSSLLSTIGVVELMKSATTVGANYYAYLPPLTVASGIYLVMTLVISAISKMIERRLAVSD